MIKQMRAAQQEAARKTEEEEADNKLARKIISMFGGGPAKAVRMSGLTEEEKREQMAIVLQATYRRHAERKRNAPQLWRVNLRYEVSILKGRQERPQRALRLVQRTRAPPLLSRRAVRPILCPPTAPTSPAPFPPITDILYMLLLAFAIQSGASPQDRFELEKTLAEAVLGKEATVGGEPATLEDISTLPEFSEWLQNGGLDLSDFQFGGRAWVRTYNELVGDVRLEVIRADKYTCPWKVDGYQRMYRLTRPYVLEDGSYSASGEYPGCYSFLTQTRWKT